MNNTENTINFNAVPIYIKNEIAEQTLKAVKKFIKQKENEKDENSKDTQNRG